MLCSANTSVSFTWMFELPAFLSLALRSQQECGAYMEFIIPAVEFCVWVSRSDVRSCRGEWLHSGGESSANLAWWKFCLLTLLLAYFFSKIAVREIPQWEKLVWCVLLLKFRIWTSCRWRFQQAKYKGLRKNAETLLIGRWFLMGDLFVKSLCCAGLPSDRGGCFQQEGLSVCLGACAVQHSFTI